MLICPICTSTVSNINQDCPTCGFRQVVDLESLNEQERSLYELSIRNSRAAWQKIQALQNQLAQLQETTERLSAEKKENTAESLFAYLVKPIKIFFKHRIAPPFLDLKTTPAIKIKTFKQFKTPNLDFSNMKVWVQADILSIMETQSRMMRKVLEEEIQSRKNNTQN